MIVCPSCGKRNKVLKKCFCCNKFVCSECSFKGLCYDCYVEEYKSRELGVY